MNCPKCGEELLNVNGKYVCAKCGIEVPEDQATNGPVALDQNQQTPEPSTAEVMTPPIPAPDSVPPELPVASDLSKVDPEPIENEPEPTNPEPILPQPEGSGSGDKWTVQPEAPTLSTNPEPLEAEPKEAEPIQPVAAPVTPDLEPLNMASATAPMMTPPVEANLATPESNPNPNTNIVQPAALPPTPNQTINAPVTDDEGLSKKKKLIIILAICGGGLAFLIIGLLVGFFVNI